MEAHDAIGKRSWHGLRDFPAMLSRNSGQTVILSVPERIIVRVSAVNRCHHDTPLKVRCTVTNEPR